jgi:protein tyrosine/serine phosphatase
VTRLFPRPNPPPGAARARAVLVALLIATPLAYPADAPRVRPDTWARPILSDHLENWHQLDDKVYRSAQPDRAGFLEATRLGIRTVLNLRDRHTDEKAVRGLDLRACRVEMEAGDIREADVVAALRILRAADGPVLVHCWHGSDRTGLVCAMYRIVFLGWSKADAIDELIHGGYGYHRVYRGIPKFIEDVDVARLRQQVFAP